MTKLKKCKKKGCEEEFETTELFTNKDFCPVCICGAQMQMIGNYTKQFATISKAMGDDFMKNLLSDIEAGRKPQEIELTDGSKGYLMDPKLFRVGKQYGSRSHRRNIQKALRKKAKK